MSTQRIENIKQRLAMFEPSKLEVIDDSHKHVGHSGNTSGGGHFTVRIGADVFTGKSRIAVHRLVYQALDGMIPDEVHALSIQLISV